LDVKGVPANSALAKAVVKEMLRQFALMLDGLANAHPDITFINGQGTLQQVTASWHNELHPEKAGFNKFADLFRAKLKALYPTRVP
jgi:predicted NBD/HSP70 family sugar kinase